MSEILGRVRSQLVRANPLHEIGEVDQASWFLGAGFLPGEGPALVTRSSAAGNMGRLTISLRE